MRANLLPPVHPGEVLHEEFMNPMGISKNVLSRELDVPLNRISLIVNGKRSITADTALRLAAFFGTSAEFWLNLQSNYELEVARRGDSARIKETVKLFKGRAKPALQAGGTSLRSGRRPDTLVPA